GQRGGRRGTQTERAPEFGHLLRLVEGALAVHHDGEGVGRIRELTERLQMPQRVAPPPAPVRGEASQLPNRWDGWRLVGHRLDSAQRLLVPPAFVRGIGVLCPLDQALSVELRRTVLGRRVPYRRRHLRRQGLATAPVGGA